jgi:hypothetical protein
MVMKIMTATISDFLSRPTIAIWSQLHGQSVKHRHWKGHVNWSRVFGRLKHGATSRRNVSG